VQAGGVLLHFDQVRALAEQLEEALAQAAPAGTAAACRPPDS
jgi:hypothetical protein